MSHQKTIFIFTRDLRLADNTSLLHALENSKTVIPIFILNPDQLTNKNKYKSSNCIQFMIESLDDLNNQLKNVGSRLFYFFGVHDDVVNDLINKEKIDAVYMNIDYSPYAKKRESKISAVCKKQDVQFHSYEDYMLTGANKVLKSDGNTYVKFTPYHRAATKIKIPEPKQNRHKNYISKNTKLHGEYKSDIHKLYTQNKNLLVHGGRSNALKILSSISEYNNYNKTRDYPIMNTTYLSAYLKFNTVSIREVYYTFKKKLKPSNKLFTQLYWRDFYMNILHHYPHVIGSPMKQNYKIKWTNNESMFKKWCNGETGIPIVDAGMRQMNTIGWMHNRLRMIVSNFLIKILHIDWQWGEQYFAQNLVDYDIANNNGGWQWSASTGSDSQPYFRIFNPWRQSEKFDKDAIYIKKWVPELESLDPKIIHNWNSQYMNYKKNNYPKPIVEDLKKAVSTTMKLYTNALK